MKNLVSEKRRNETSNKMSDTHGDQKKNVLEFADHPRKKRTRTLPELIDTIWARSSGSTKKRGKEEWGETKEGRRSYGDRGKPHDSFDATGQRDGEV